MDSRIRLMELAGIKLKKEDEQLEEDMGPGTIDHYGMDDGIEWNDMIQGYSSLLKNAEESDEGVEELESINKRADQLYPGKKYHGMYAGEHMSESIDYIETLNDKDSIELPKIL